MKRFLLLLLVACTRSVLAADDYVLGPDSQPQEGVPKGTVTKHSWTSKTFPGTVRDYWIYVPAQYNASQPACVMVFQDGGGYVRENGEWRVPVVFDNLIHKKEMPVTIGIFINPGVVPPAGPNQLARFNRSFEYDGLGDRYARFLLEEILPEVAKNYNLVKDGNGRAIAGSSSGAICAWTVAWERPQEFSRVFSTIGTFVNLRGGHNYPGLVRKTEPKPIRIFLQDGSNDLNIYGGNWWFANQDMEAALTLAGYDVKHVWGEGSHSGKHGGSILPEALRWLWRDYPAPVAKATQSKLQIMEVLLPGEEWQVVGEGYKFTEGPAANEKGEVFFTDIPNNRIHKIGLDGKVTVFKEESGAANGLMFGPNGKLYACQGGKKRVVVYDERGAETVIAEEIEANDLAISHGGNIYVTEPSKKQVWFINATGEKKVADTGIGNPNGVILSPDQSLLLVADTQGQFVYSFQIQADGSLAHKQPYFHLHIPDGKTGSGADGMAVDSAGRLYVTTQMGIQFCDQAGRVNGIILKPQEQWLANVKFGGPNLDYLYATCADKVYRRKTKAKGVLSAQAPVMPPPPKL